MRKKLLLMLGAGALTVVMSSCWALQNFTIGDYTLTPGQTTKAKLTLRPMGAAYKTVFTGARQFVIIGVGALGGDTTDIGVSNARWAVNGQFGGPQAMGVENDIVTSLASGDCAQSGLDFTDITGVTWKAFATLDEQERRGPGREEVRDRGTPEGEGRVGRCRGELHDHGRRRRVEATTVTVRPSRRRVGTRTSAGGSRQGACTRSAARSSGRIHDRAAGA